MSPPASAVSAFFARSAAILGLSIPGFVLAILVYGVGASVRPLVRRPVPPRDPHPDMVDDVLLVDDAIVDPPPSRTIAE